jgi:hypothetical protein
MCKTPNDIYISGVSEITTEPAYFDNILEYKGRYFKVGTDRLEVKSYKGRNTRLLLSDTCGYRKGIKVKK